MRGFLAYYLTPLVLAALSLGVMMLGETGFEALSYQRAAIVEGEVWRLLSGHWLHLGWGHLMLNLAGLILVWALFGQTLAGMQGVVVVLVVSVGLSLSLFVFHPELDWYVGYSGLLHGLFSAGAVIGLSLKTLRLVSAVGLILLIVKLTAETWAGASASWVVAEAHLLGALWGLLGCMHILIRNQKRGIRE